MSRRYSNSYINQFAFCPLSAHYKYDIRLRPLEDSQHAAAFSKALHPALESLHVNKDVEKAKQVFTAHYPAQSDVNDHARTLPNGLKVLDFYRTHYQGDPQWKTLAAEQMDSTEDGHIVKLDLVVADTRNGDILGVDHKVTSKYLNFAYWNHFNPNSQITQYVRYIKEKYGRCDGFVINAISLTWLNEKDKAGRWNGRYFDPADKSKPWLAYSERDRRYVKYYKQEMVAAWGLQISVERQTFNRTPQQIEQDQISRFYWISRIEDAKATGIYGMATDRCFLCEYQPICGAGWDWENDAELIRSNYRQVCEKWVPELNAHCGLDLNHAGDHAPFQPDPAVSPEFVVAV